MVNLDEPAVAPEIEAQGPEWARLKYHQCPHCPLSQLEHAFCPVALRISDLVKAFTELRSYEEIDVMVSMRERSVCQTVTVQRLLCSLMGLMMATCGCPVTDFFRPMAENHLPFSTEAETMNRAISTYLTSQMLLSRQGEDVDFSLNGLQEIYDDVHEMNYYVAQRLHYLEGSEPSR